MSRELLQIRVNEVSKCSKMKMSLFLTYYCYQNIILSINIKYTGGRILCRGILSKGILSKGDFVKGILSGSFVQGGFCPDTFLRYGN